ncbi:unnamed protein product [Cuscuta europaea]|uniref:Uncharacterized protein n=1 Tax=Cuscuta europaea TaxID=41803 RepID=A0A9P0ZMR1_CUSEU|nr:unnamed protein product [Cuscuta europaea]
MEQADLIAHREAKAVRKQAALEKARAAQSSEANSSAASKADRRIGEAEQQLIAVVMGQSTEAPNTETGPIIDAESVGTAPLAGGEKAKGKKPKRKHTEPFCPKAPDTLLLPPCRPVSEVWRKVALQTGVELSPRSSIEAVIHALALTLEIGLSLLQAEATREQDALETKRRAEEALRAAREAAQQKEDVARAEHQAGSGRAGG